MADMITLEMVLPDRLLMSAEVSGVVVPGSEGDFMVLPGHAPVITTLRPAIVEIIETEGAESTKVFVRGGFADVAVDRLTVLAEEAMMLADLDQADLEQRVKNASEDIEDAKSDDDRARAQAVYDQLSELLRSLD